MREWPAQPSAIIPPDPVSPQAVFHRGAWSAEFGRSGCALILHYKLPRHLRPSRPPPSLPRWSHDSALRSITRNHTEIILSKRSDQGNILRCLVQLAAQRQMNVVRQQGLVGATHFSHEVAEREARDVRGLLQRNGWHFVFPFAFPT